MTRIAIAALSVLVLAVTRYFWSQVQALATEQNILLVGLDTRSDAQGNPLPQAVLDELHAGAGTTGGDNTDTMIVVHIPAGSGTATAISIPRDSYVAIAGGYGTHKINSAYTYGKHAAATALASHGVSGAALEVQSAAQGARTAILTVQQLTGLTITHYGAVNLVGFAAISQAVGGVPVCLNNPVDDPLSGAVFPAGPQVLQGAQALAFVRQRHGLPLGDLDRIKRQQVFLASLARTVLSGATLTDPAKLSALVAAIEKALTIDQGWDVLSFAQQLQGLSAGHITFATNPIVSPSLQTPHAEVVLLHVAGGEVAAARWPGCSAAGGAAATRTDRSFDALAESMATQLLKRAAQRLGRPAATRRQSGRIEREVVAAAEGADLLICARDGDCNRLGPRSLGTDTRFRRPRPVPGAACLARNRPRRRLDPAPAAARTETPATTTRADVTAGLTLPTGGRPAG